MSILQKFLTAIFLTAIFLTAAIPTLTTGGSKQLRPASNSAVEQRQACSYIVGVDDDRPVAVFSIHNDSNAAKAVTNIRKSCNCYRAELSNNVISPNETASLSFYLNQPTLRRPAKNAIQCIVEFDDQSRATCIADCTAYPSMSWVDEDLDIGNIDLNDTATHKIPVIVYSRDIAPPKVTVRSQSAECQIDGALLDFSDSSETEGVCLHRGHITCGITPTIDRKGGGTAITLSFASGKREQNEAISLNWSTKSAYSFHPRMLVLRGVTDNPQARAEVLVSHAGSSADLRIEKVECPYSELLQVETENGIGPGRASLKMSLKNNKMPLDAKPLYGDVLVYVREGSAPLNVPFVVVP